MGKDITALLFYPAVLALLLFPAASISGPANKQPSIAIIIDDMGDKLSRGKTVVALPGKVTLSFLPHAPHSKTLANRAHALGKEVMLHLPMETVTGRRLGLGGLTLHMTESELKTTTKKAIASIPYVQGVNNHMGSLLTRHPGAMGWLMQQIKEQEKLYFIDSRTTAHSVAGKIAVENGLPSAQRDVFLDDVRDKSSIRKEFKRLLRQAKKNGSAIGIGHPRPETIEVLRREISKLDSKGIRLVSVSEIIDMRKENAGQQKPLPEADKVVKRLQQLP